MIKFAKVRDVKSPQRKFGDAGIDFFVPQYNQELLDYLKAKNPEFERNGGRISQNDILIPPGIDILIPSGVRVQMSSNVCLIQFTKSGVGAKKHLDCFNGVIDSSYQGEPHIHLINQGLSPQTVQFGEKITQFVPVQFDADDISVEDYYEGWFPEKTDRGAEGFGSTGTK